MSVAAPAPSRSLSPALEQCALSFQQAVADARNLASSVANDRLEQRPGHGRWSCLECLVHLNLTNGSLLPEIERAIDKAPDLANESPTYHMDLAGRLLAWSLEPPARIRMKTTPLAQPAKVEDWRDVLATFESQHRRLIALLGKSVGKDICSQRIKSPFADLHY